MRTSLFLSSYVAALTIVSLGPLFAPVRASGGESA